MKHEITPFNYNGSNLSTITDEHGEIWFIAKDVCAVLEHSNVSMALAGLDEDERSKFKLGRQGEVNAVNESGLYSLILNSRKPEAKPFKKWVTSEVLPTIRKTGKYEAKPVSAANAPRLSVVAQDWKAAKALAKARGLNDNHSILSADKAALTLHGLDVPSLLGAPVLKADERGLTLTPGEALRMLPRFASLHIQHAGRIANAMLERNGYLIKTNGQWEPTEKAKSLGEWGDVNTAHGKGSPKKQWRWFKEIIDVFAGFEAANDDDKSAA